MLHISRAAARKFRSLLRRSVLAAAPRGRCPPIVATSGHDGSRLQASSLDVGLVLRFSETEGPEEAIAFPGDLLAQWEAASDEPIVLETLSASSARATWKEGPVPRSIEFSQETAAPIAVSDDTLAPMADDFVKSLDDACRTAARESIRFALNRIQLRGKTGEIIATDGKQMLMQRGFSFPFGDDLLIPALPVFAAKDLTGATPVRLGCVKNCVAIQAGPWQIHLAIDTAGRFPDWRQVVPRGRSATELTLDNGDAEYLVDVLPGHPEKDDETGALTLDLNSQAMARVATDGQCIELELCGSSACGSPVRITLDRKLFFRGLRLGFRSFKVHAPDRPIVGHDATRLLVLMPLADSVAVPPSPNAVHLTTNGREPTRSISIPERNTVMPTSSDNGHATEPAETLDPLAEAEAIKAGVQDLLTRAARLVASLRQFRRQRRTVESALESLRTLKLGS